MNQKTASAPAAENKMGTMPIGKLLFNMSLPMMVSMLVQALYNIVDSIFVAKLSENALTAVSLAFPLQMLLIAVATGTGVGMNALLSRALGAKKTDEANKIASNAAFLYIISYIVFLILGFTVVKPFYSIMVPSICHTETCNPLIQPPVHHVINFLPQLRILPVQIWLFLTVKMQIILICLRRILPCTSTEI